MRRKQHHWAIAMIIIVMAAGFLLAMNQAIWAGSWGNDNYTALYHINQIRTLGISQVIRVNWARIPSLFPDYGLALVADFAGKTAKEKFLLSCFLQAALGIGAITLLFRITRVASPVGCSLLSAACTTGSAFVSTGFRLFSWIASLPVNHGGNWINTALYLALALQLTTDGIIQTRRKQFLTAIIVAIFTFSNRLIVLTGLLPVLVIHLLPTTCLPYKRDIHSLGLLLKSSGMGALLGLGFFHLAPHQCSEGLTGTADFGAILNVIIVRSPALVFILVPTILWIAMRMKVAHQNAEPQAFNPKQMFLGDTLAIQLMLSSITYPLLARGEPELIYLRYILTPLMLSPVLFVLTAISFHALRISFFPRGVKLAVISAVFAGYGLAASNFSGPTKVDEAYRADNILLKRLPTIIQERCRQGKPCILLATNPPFNGLKIHLEFAQPELRLLEISGHGDPLVFWMSRSDFFENREFTGNKPEQGLLLSSVIATSTSQAKSIIHSLGWPDKQVHLDSFGHVLLVYNNTTRLRSKFATFFNDQSQLPFCVPNDIKSLWLKFRSLL